MTRLLALALVMLAALAACTPTPQPSPSPTRTGSTSAPTFEPEVPEPDRRVAVVVAPGPTLRAAAAEVAARQLPDAVPGVSDVRVVNADDPEAMADLVRLFVSEGYDLVCALGPGALDAVLGAARDVPATRFCASPVIATEVPDNVLAVDIRAEEMAYLAGVMAGAYVPDQPPVMVTAATTHASARQQQAFRDGFASTSPPAGVIPIIVGPVEDAEAAEAAVTEHLRAGASAVYTDAGEADTGVVAAAGAEGDLRQVEASEPPESGASEPPTTGTPTTVLVVGGPSVLPLEEGAPVPTEVAYVVEFNWARAVVVAAQRLVGTWEGGIVSIGLLEDALRFVEDGGAAVPPPVRTRIEDTRAGIIDGRLVIGTPT